MQTPSSSGGFAKRSLLLVPLLGIVLAGSRRSTTSSWQSVGIRIIYAAPLAFAGFGLVLLMTGRFSAPATITASVSAVGAVVVAMRATLLSDRLLLSDVSELASRVSKARMNRRMRRHGGLQGLTEDFERRLASLSQQIRPVRQTSLKGTYLSVVDSANELDVAAGEALDELTFAQMFTAMLRRIIAQIALEDAGTCLDQHRYRANLEHAPPPGHQVATQPVCPHGPPRQPAAPPEWATAGWLAA